MVSKYDDPLLSSRAVGKKKEFLSLYGLNRRFALLRLQIL